METKLSTKAKRATTLREERMAKKGQKLEKYNKEFKEEIIKLKLEQGKGYEYLSKKYNIPEGTINTWVYQYRKNNNQMVMKKRGRPKEEDIDYKERYEILKKYQGFLKEAEQEKK